MSAVDGGEWSASRAANFTTEEGGHFNHGREGVVDLRGGLEVLENKKKNLAFDGDRTSSFRSSSP